MLTVERCHECPECNIAGNVCMVKRRAVNSLGPIPDWCPLPDTPRIAQADIMPQWDEYAGMLRRGEGGSLPRDWFENLLDALGVPLEKPSRAERDET